MSRRRFLCLGFGSAVFLLCTAHTPYRQWTVYRKRHLLIGTSRSDLPTYGLGQQIAEILAAHLPESRARVSRAPDPWRLASLISTEQIELILLAENDARALMAGDAPFEDFGGVSLAGLVRFGNYVLVCRPDFPEEHAYLVTQTLCEHAGETLDAVPLDPSSGPIPGHAGAMAYALGLGLPAATED